MKRIAFLVLFLILQSNSLAAAGGFVSGTRLVGWIHAAERIDAGKASGDDIDQFTVYVGYMQGVYDVWNGVLICPTNGTTVGQMQAIVSKYMLANPEKWNRAASALILVALAEPFPCKK